jgi:4'-phosphopantetheinyl transferase
MMPDSTCIEPRFTRGEWNVQTDTLQPGDIQLWYFDLSDTNSLLEPARSRLTPDDAARAGRFLRQEPQNSFMIRRGLLRRLLGLHTGSRLYPCALEYSAGGQPMMPVSRDGLRPLFFSVSHTGSDLLFALAKSWPVGVDIEEERPVRDLQRMMLKSCSGEEINRISKLPEPERVRAFYKVWTLKEAISKAAGSGLTPEILRNSPSRMFHQYYFTLLNRMAGAVAAEHPVLRFRWRTCPAKLMIGG